MTRLEREPGIPLTFATRAEEDAYEATHRAAIQARRKGDVFGVLPKVHVGARGVKLPLDQLQKEDESLAGAQMGGGMPAGHP